MKKIINRRLIKKIVSMILYILLVMVLLVVIIQKISNNNLSFFGYRIFRVASGSMEPEYKVNDILLVKDTAAEEIKKGDNISYKKEIDGKSDLVITHKVIDIDKNFKGELDFHTKGIANTIEDPIVKEEQIYGIVIKKIYLLSFINILIHTIYGFILLVLITLIMIYSNIKELIMIVKEKKNEE